MKINRSILLGFISFLIFLLSAIYITYPLIFHIGDKVTGYGDELVIAWIQNWVIHALFTNPLSLFQANLYYPYHNTLSFSESFITSSIMAIPARILVGQPITTENFTLIKAITILGVSIYILSYYITKNFLASLLAGLLVVFSPAVLSNYMHLQILDIGWVVLSMLFFCNFLQNKKTLSLGLSFFFFLFQIYNAILPGYFLLFFYLISIILYKTYTKTALKKFITQVNVSLCLLVVLFLIPLGVSYFSVSQEFHYVRDIRDSIHFALQPEDLLYPGSTTRLQTFLATNIPTNQYSQNSEFKPGYLGVIFSLLTVISIIYFVKNFKKRNIFLIIFIAVALTGLILSLGPFLHINRHTVHKPFPIPLPYAVFYYVIPGFNGIRNSQMWEMLFCVSMAVVIAIVLNQNLLKIPKVTRVFIYTILFIATVGEFNGPIPLIDVPQIKSFPQVYSWLATTPEKSSYIILPIYNWNMPPFTQQELWREYYGTIEFRKSVNGYTGFSPPPWQDFIYSMHKTFPNRESVKEIHSLEVNYILIDKIAYDKEHLINTKTPPSSTVILTLKSYKNLKFIKNVGNYSIFNFDEVK